MSDLSACRHMASAEVAALGRRATLAVNDVPPSPRDERAVFAVDREAKEGSSIALAIGRVLDLRRGCGTGGRRGDVSRTQLTTALDHAHSLVRQARGVDGVPVPRADDDVV